MLLSETTPDSDLLSCLRRYSMHLKAVQTTPHPRVEDCVLREKEHSKENLLAFAEIDKTQSEVTGIAIQDE
jgi:hypothetical protein